MNKIKKLILALTGAGIVMAAGNTAIPSEIKKEKVRDIYNASEQVKGKYRLENAKMVREAKANPKDRLEIEVGDDGENFKPKVKVERWDDEVNFSLELIDNETGKETGKETLATEGDKIKWAKGNKTARFYEIAPSEQYPEGAFEFDIELAKKPKTNKIEFSLNTKGVDFYHQPSLKKEYKNGYSEEFKKEIVVTDTDVKDLDGNVLVHRPDNVVDSEVVYASEQKTNYVGGKEYKNSKVGMIYRPKIYDASGAECWGILSVDKEAGKLSVEIPQEFLDNAVYPVVVDPTFGYDGTGETSIAVMNYNYFVGALRTTPSNIASISSITFKIKSSSGSKYFKSILVLNQNLNIITNGIGGVSDAVTTTAGLHTSSFSTQPTPSASTAYLLGGVFSDNLTGYYDSSSEDLMYSDSSNSYSSPSNPTDATKSWFSSGKSFTIYATYTEGGGETSRRIIITQ